MNRANPFARHGTIITLSVLALLIAIVPARAESDCNRNGIEDACDVDCGEPEGPCDVPGCGGKPDCNRNNIPDECDVADATSEDCNGDERPDECDTLFALFESPPLGPFGAGQPQEFVVPAPTLTGGVVRITVSARADLGAASEEAFVALNGVELGVVFGVGGNDCPQEPDQETLVISADEYNRAVGGHDATFVISASDAVDPNPALCESFIQLRIEYQAITDTDCNGSGLPDSCDVANGSSVDCNGNLVPDECELRLGKASDCQPNGVLDECDIAVGTSQDCNENGVPDTCDLASGTHQDCQPNGVLDACDIAERTSPDCNENGVPDSCDVASGAGHDCQANGVLDSCDLSSGTSQDASPANGIPDECDNRLVSAFPACDATLPRLQNNTVRLTLSGNVPAPAPGQVVVQELLAGGGFGPDLSPSFIITVEPPGNVLKVRENGAALQSGKWYAIRNAGAWGAVMSFEVDVVVVHGDADNSRHTNFFDLGNIFGNLGAASDVERRDMDGSGVVAFFDINLAFGKVGQFAPTKPDGHACIPVP